MTLRSFARAAALRCPRRRDGATYSIIRSVGPPLRWGGALGFNYGLSLWYETGGVYA